MSRHSQKSKSYLDTVHTTGGAMFRFLITQIFISNFDLNVADTYLMVNIQIYSKHSSHREKQRKSTHTHRRTVLSYLTKMKQNRWKSIRPKSRSHRIHGTSESRHFNNFGANSIQFRIVKTNLIALNTNSFDCLLYVLH